MISIDPNDLSKQGTYKLLIGSIIPRPIAFVTTLSEQGVINAAPFSYFNIVSSKPPLLSISIGRVDGELKDTARNIIAKKQFVIHIVDEDIVAAVNETAARLAPNENELLRTDLTTIASKVIDVPGVKEAKIRFECILEEHIPLGDENFISTDLMIGRIAHIEIANDIYQDGKIDPRGLQPISRLAGASYAKVGEIFDIARPD